jgi:hypothetical protein
MFAAIVADATRNLVGGFRRTWNQVHELLFPIFGIQRKLVIVDASSSSGKAQARGADTHTREAGCLPADAGKLPYLAQSIYGLAPA